MEAGRFVIEPAAGGKASLDPHAGGDPNSSLGGPRTAHEVAVQQQLKPSTTRASRRALPLRHGCGSARGGSIAPRIPSIACSSPFLSRSRQARSKKPGFLSVTGLREGFFAWRCGLLHRAPGTIRRHCFETIDTLPKAGRDRASAQYGRFVNGSPGHAFFLHDSGYGVMLPCSMKLRQGPAIIFSLPHVTRRRRPTSSAAHAKQARP